MYKLFEKKQKIICYIKKYWHNILIPLIVIATGLLTGSRLQTIIYVVFTAVVIIMKLGNKYDYVDLLKQHWKKIIIICPKDLTYKWQREMKYKFGEHFTILSSGMLNYCLRETDMDGEWPDN